MNSQSGDCKRELLGGVVEIQDRPNDIYVVLKQYELIWRQRYKFEGVPLLVRPGHSFLSLPNCIVPWVYVCSLCHGALPSGEAGSVKIHVEIVFVDVVDSIFGEQVIVGQRCRVRRW